MEDSATYNSTLRTFDISVNISWQQPQYSNGEITAYSYRLVETSNPSVEIITDTNTTDLGLSVVQSVTVSPFTNYTATVVAYTSAGSGETSTEVTVSPEAGNYYSAHTRTHTTYTRTHTRSLRTYTHHLSLSLLTHLTAPATPREVTATNLSSIEIFVTWQQPDPANGIIQQYIVTYYPSGSPSDDTTVSTSNTSITIGGLSAFTNYSVFVVAVTVAPGPASTTVTVTTSEAGAYMCVCVYVGGLVDVCLL